MPKPRRTKHFVDSNVQGSLTRRVILHWLVLILISSVVAFILQVLSDPFRPLTNHMENLWWSQGPILLVMIFLLPVFVLDTIKLSHRFAGPIFSLRRAIRGIAQGEAPKKLKFRRLDFWHDLAEDYNAMLARLGALEDGQDEGAQDEKLVKSK
jgi:nitrogen fixation/metabolism regulation signal transduction histidine kinase